MYCMRFYVTGFCRDCCLSDFLDETVIDIFCGFRGHSDGAIMGLPVCQEVGTTTDSEIKETEIQVFILTFLKMASAWEEITMVMELPSGGQTDARRQGDSYFQILGLSTEKPLVKINGHLFAGQFRDTLGSHLLLEVEEKPGAKPTKDNSQRNSMQIKSVAVTNKYLKLEPVYLDQKKDAESQ